MMRIKLMYKIHGLNTANGMSNSAGNDTFYETEEEALNMARSYVERGGWYKGHDSMVVYKAHVLVRRHEAPVEVLTVESDGEVLDLEGFTRR